MDFETVPPVQSTRNLSSPTVFDSSAQRGKLKPLFRGVSDSSPAGAPSPPYQRTHPSLELTDGGFPEVRVVTVRPVTARARE